MLKGWMRSYSREAPNMLSENGSKVQGLSVKKAVISQDEYRRYGRHLIMPEVGIAGQERLKSSKVLVVGAGGLGSPCSLYLAAAGVGTIGIVDYDTVDETNLHRQILFNGDDVGSSKALTASTKLSKVNPNLEIKTHEEKLTSKNALEILREYDIIIDGTDNFPLF